MMDSMMGAASATAEDDIDCEDGHCAISHSSSLPKEKEQEEPHRRGCLPLFRRRRPIATSSTTENDDDNPPIPEDLPPLTASEQRTYRHLKSLQYYMDDCFGTICGRQFGLDPLLGLLPLVGDCASAVVSLTLVARAATSDLSRYTVLRMLFNVGLDTVTGTVPLFGDVFDVGWKANQRNVTIYEDFLRRGRDARRDVDRRWLIVVVLSFLLLCLVGALAVMALTVLFILWLMNVL